jgi:hypothetical protein
MLSEFEQRFSDVLGARLPAPFTGRTALVGNAPASQTVLVVGVQKAQPLVPDFNSRRPEMAPGVDDRRRVVRLRCTVGVDVHPRSTSENRRNMLDLLDAALYTLDDRDFLANLVQPGDPGFLIERIQLVDSIIPNDPHAEGSPAVGLSLSAEGWFWPVGQPGQAGIAIGEVRVRGVVLPLVLSPSDPTLVAGGPPVDLMLRFQARGAYVFDGGSSPVPPLPFGSLALALRTAGGQPGLGQLSGGTAGVDGVHLVPVSDGQATVTYTPPAEAAVDELVVGLDNGADGLGVELGRMTLEVRD